MKELINHFVLDTVSLQIVAVVLLAFALANWRGHVEYSEHEPPRTFAGVGTILALWLFVLVAGVASYYGAPIRTVGKISLWALHVGLIAFARLLFVKPDRHGLRSFLNDAARFEAIASLGVLFLTK